VASNDLAALLVYEAARQAGVCIPGDVALVGFDNLDFTMQLNLTTMQQQAHQIGVEAARLLLRRIRGECEGPLEIRVPARLVVRGSSMRPCG
jgi:DNA-binding LacI/PurR family transcriptional regulator